MPTEVQQLYRQRIYAQYVTASDKPLAPPSIEGLRSRLPFCRNIVRQHFPRDRSAAILELGCGHGAFLYVMHQAGYKGAKGVDGAADQVSASRQLGTTSVEEADVMSALIATANASL